MEHYCPHCRNKLPKNAKFCNICGRPVDKPSPKKGKLSPGMVFLLVLLCCSVVLLGILAGVLVSRLLDRPKDTASSRDPGRIQAQASAPGTPDSPDSGWLNPNSPLPDDGDADDDQTLPDDAPEPWAAPPTEAPDTAPGADRTEPPGPPQPYYPDPDQPADDVMEFCRQVAGVWVDMSTITGWSYSGVVFDRGVFSFVTVPGEYNRPAVITDVTALGEDCWQMDYCYEAGEFNGDLFPEEYGTVTITLDAGCLMYWGDHYLYSYGGHSFEMAGNFTDWGYGLGDIPGYDSKVEEYRQALITGVCDIASINKIAVENARTYGDMGIRYGYYDLDGNGTEELLFSDGRSILDAYTLQAGTPVKLFENAGFGYRSSLHVLSGGRFLAVYDNSAFCSNGVVYRMTPWTLSSSIAEAESWFFDSSEEGMFSGMEGEKISPEAFTGLMEELKADSIFDNITWYPVG